MAESSGRKPSKWVFYYPKGGMCKGCADYLKNCSALDFSSMRSTNRKDRVGEVVCSEFLPGEKE